MTVAVPASSAASYPQTWASSCSRENTTCGMARQAPQQVELGRGEADVSDPQQDFAPVSASMDSPPASMCRRLGFAAGRNRRRRIDLTRITSSRGENGLTT